jgi:hypothetical protein
MRSGLVLLALFALAGTARGERMPWYRGFYTRVGIRDSFGVQEPFHAWAALAFGLGYRFDRGVWGLDGSVLNLQSDPEEGMHTLARIAPYVSLAQWTRIDVWLGTGLSYGWVKGTVDEAIAKRHGEGWQAELVGGIDLPRELRVRLFVQGTLTFPLYSLRDMYQSRDSVLYVYAAEASLGVRF